MNRLISLLLSPLLVCAASGVADEVTITEWDVPWEDTRPRDPDVADDQAHAIWFVGQTGHYLGLLDAETGEFSRVGLADGTGPHNLVVDDDGTVWFAGNRAAHIGHYFPDEHRIVKLNMPDGHPRDPHTLILDRRGHIWFTAQGANVIGRLDKKSEELRVIDVPTERARPYGIVVDDGGRPWVAMVGTYKLATVDPETLELEEIDLPREDAAPRRIAIGADGGIWYVDYAQGYLGRLDPETREIREWRAPSAENARPYAMAADDRGRIWFFETGPQPNRLIGFDIETEEFLPATDVPSGGGTVRHMVFHPPTNTLWFGTDTHTIGRAELPE